MEYVLRMKKSGFSALRRKNQNKSCKYLPCVPDIVAEKANISDAHRGSEVLAVKNNSANCFEQWEYLPTAFKMCGRFSIKRIELPSSKSKERISQCWN